MAKKHRKCICCGSEYTYCPTCGGQDKLKPTWYSEFCCEECKELFDTATRFNMNMLSKEAAKKKIESLNLKPHTEYVECVQRDLKNILEEPQQEQKQFKASKPKDMK